MVSNIFVVSIIQLLFAITWFIIPIIARAYGEHAQEAAEKNVLDQGINGGKDFLLKNGVKFSESRIEMLLPFAIGILMVFLGVLNLTGNELGKNLTWIITPIVFFVVGFVTSAQVFVSQYLKRAFKKSKDTRFHQIDVDKLISVVMKIYPHWLREIQIIRFLLATAGSIIIILLLILE